MVTSVAQAVAIMESCEIELVVGERWSFGVGFLGEVEVRDAQRVAANPARCIAPLVKVRPAEVVPPELEILRSFAEVHTQRSEMGDDAR